MPWPAHEVPFGINPDFVHIVQWIRPWLYTTAHNGVGEYGCAVCGIETWKKKRHTAATFLRTHRHCGLSHG